MTTLRTQISDAVIKRHAADGSITELADTRHGMVRFRYHKSRVTGSWYMVRHQGNKSPWKKMGRWPDLPAKRLIELIPQAQAALAVEPDAPVVVDSMETVGQLLVWHRHRTETDRNLSASRRSSIISIINKHLLPRLSKVPCAELDHQALDEMLIWPLQREYALATVRQVLSTLKAATKKAAGLKLLTVDPLTSIKFTDFIQSPILTKDGALRPDDLPDVIAAIKAADPEHAMLCWLMLMHGTRIGETRLATVAEFDLGGAWWRIPADHTKTSRAIKLPLTPLASSKLAEYLQGHKSRLLFPNRRGGPISATLANQWVQYVSGRQWTAHDLRKLARTCWMDQGVDYLVAEMLLNHALQRMDRTYIHTYADQKQREALEGWHGLLAKCSK